MMLDIEHMDVDLSIVKKERLELDDYGQNSGNILDNFISEHDYQDFPQNVSSNVPNIDNEDVDWLSSFFDDPLHDHMSALNPPLTDIISSTNCTTSISKLASITGGNDVMLSDSIPKYAEDYMNGNHFNSCGGGIKSPVLPSSPTIRDCNPLLSQTKQSKSMFRNEEQIEIKLEESKQNEGDKNFSKTEKQNQQKLLLFMNTPENRAKLAGTNFNIVNANLLSKISGQNNDKSVNVIHLKKCIKLTNDPASKSLSCESKPIIATPRIILNKNSGITDILQTSLLQGIIKKEQDNLEIDSGYESPNSNGSPGSPPLDLEKSSYDTYIDVPPHERQPFYLSEEEKRTLIIEGLPVPTSLPLNKMEERALKKVRRKIKNKISAQESRRKKKEYMEALEKRVDSFASENSSLKKKMNNLEVANRSLILQVQKLQALVSKNVANKPTSPESEELMVT